MLKVTKKLSKIIIFLLILTTTTTDLYPLLIDLNINNNGARSFFPRSSGFTPSLTTPDNITYYEGDPRPYSFSWVVTDLSVGSNPYYVLYHNGDFFHQDGWSTGDTISIDVSDYLEGTHVINLTVWDDEDNCTSDVVQVLVSANSNPSISNNQSTIVYAQGNTDVHTINWTINDSAVLHTNYSISVNYSQIVQTGGWTTGDDILYDATGLPTGTHYFTLYTRDGFNGESSNTVTVVVGGVTSPSWESTQSDLEFYEDDPRYREISWNLTDATVDNPYYILYCDNQMFQTGSWTSGNQIIASIQNLNYRTQSYFFELWVYDGTGSLAYDTCNVLIHENYGFTASIYYTGDLIEGTPGEEYFRFYLSDSSRYNAEYQILLNGTMVQNDTWTGGYYYYYYDHLLAADYRITLNAHDGMGKTYTTYRDITVEVNNEPSTNSPDDISFVKGETTSVYVQWYVSDSDYYGTYKPVWIFDNDTQLWYDSNDWSYSDEWVSYYLNDLAVGVHNLTFYAFDGYNKNGTDSVLVTVQPNDDVAISPHQGNLTYTAGDPTIYSFNWTALDLTTDSGTYTIYKDATPQKTGSWSNGSVLGIDVSGVQVGSYTYRLNLQDGYGKSADDYIDLDVLTNTIPTINNPSSIDFVFGDPDDYNIIWNVTDSTIGPTFFNVTKNGALFDSGSWESGVPLPTVDLNVLIVGSYTFSVTAWDGCGASVSNSVDVQVNANDDPAITHPDNVTFVAGDPTIDVLSWTITDATTKSPTYQLINNGSVVGSDSWASGIGTSGYDISILGVGIHEIMINATDGYGVNIIDNVTVTINPNNAPSIGDLGDITYTEGDPASYSLQWTITDAEVRTTNYNLTIDGSLERNTTWISEAALPPLDVSGWSDGTYTI
ncbi:MAG: hypothetical protein GY870_00275, partial [archaeon]|nr:hypothetical protein [archaeon]